MMKSNHVVALLCFAVAIACYALDGKPDLTGGFTVLGLFFETLAWRNTLKRQAR